MENTGWITMFGLVSVEGPVYRMLFSGLSVHSTVWEVEIWYFDFIAIDFADASCAKKKEGRIRGLCFLICKIDQFMV